MLLATQPFVAAKPTDIADCTLWLDADDLAGVDGDPIGTWANKGSLGGNATSATTARPTLVTDANGYGRQGLRFDGSDDHITTASGAWVSSAGWTCMAVFSCHNQTSVSTGLVVDADNGSGTGRVAQFLGVGDSRARAIPFNTASAAVNADGPVMGAAGLSMSFSIYEPTGVRVQVDGVDGPTFTTVGTPRSTNTPIRVGARLTGTQSMYGVVCEVAIWSRPLTAAEIVRVRTYLDSKYRIEAIRRKGADIAATSVAFAANIRGDLPVLSEATANDAGWIRDQLCTDGTTQYATYIDPTLKYKVTKRTHGSSTWDTPVELTDLGTANNDSHYASSIGVDADGYIHMVGNTRNSAIDYIRSTNPDDITAWTVSSMVGTEEDSATYPQFFTANGRFFFWYRNGAGGTGPASWYLNEYSSGSWSRVSNPLGGAPYPFRVAVSPVDHSFHLTWCQRSAGGLNGHYDLGYLKSSDYGATWTTGAGASFTVPAIATSRDALVATTPDEGSGLFPGAACVDQDGNLRVGTWLYGADGFLEMWHAMFIGGVLQLHQVTYSREQPDLADGVFPSAFRRPQMVSFTDGTVWMVWTSKSPAGMFVADVTDPTNITVSEVTGTPGLTQLPYDENAVRTRSEFWTLMPATNNDNAAASIYMVSP